MSSPKKQIRIACAGGGTGGHIYPMIAVIDELQKILQSGEYENISSRLYYFGMPHMYAPYFTRRNVIIKHVFGFKLRRYFSLLNIVDALKAPLSFFQAFWHMFWVMPDVLFSKGGSGAIPVVLAAVFFRVPIVVHESDVAAGLSNKIAFRFAARISISFQATLDALTQYKQERIAVVGNPIRSVFTNQNPQNTQEKAKKIFGFDELLPVIVVLGGSQGSERINDFMLDNASELIKKYQVLHQTGTNNFADAKNELAVASKNFIDPERQRYKLVDFVGDEIVDVLRAADIVISRAGSGAIFECAACAKASILIPLKGSAGNHQVLNAYEYQKNGACVVVEEDNLKTGILFQEIDKIFQNQTRKTAMEQAALAFAKPQAAFILAREIIRLA